MGPDEPVWMREWCAYWSDYSERYIHPYAATCSDCSAYSLGLRKVRDGLWRWPVTGEYWFEGACETCGRTVFKKQRYMRRHFFCGDTCRETYYSRRRRASKPEKTCEQCGKEFSATRRDQKTCSAACKQKAYRKRNKAQEEEEDR